MYFKLSGSPRQLLPRKCVVSTPNLIISYCNSRCTTTTQSASSRFRTLLHALLSKLPKSCHITLDILRSLSWLKIPERFEYKHFTLTDKVLQPARYYISIQPFSSTQSSSVLTPARSPASSASHITARSLAHRLCAKLRRGGLMFCCCFFI